MVWVGLIWFGLVGLGFAFREVVSLNIVLQKNTGRLSFLAVTGLKAK